MQPREVTTLITAQPTTDGAGVSLSRSLGSRALSMLDPFLMLDQFRSDRPEDYLAGFPDHPHRGFETVTYMLHGAMEHRDSLGNRGRLGPGSVQWMTAGHGIIHSEMPKQISGLMWGFQLWVNLPARLKMTRPRYQDLAAETIPSVQLGDAMVRVVAGSAGGIRGPVEGIAVEPVMLDATLPAAGLFRQPVPPNHNAFVYVVDGTVEIGARRTPASTGQLAVLDGGEGVEVASASSGRFLMLAGKPIGEPVARYGPFVMNTQEEILRAVDDYRSGRLTQG